MPNRDYTADARKLTLDHVDDLFDIDAMTIGEVLDTNLNPGEIEAIAEQVKDFAAYLKAAVEAYAPAKES